MSDEIYYQQDRQDHRTNRRNVSLTDLEETEQLSVPSVKAAWIRQEEREKVWKEVGQFLKSGTLTEVQQRRFRQHYFEELSTRQIARACLKIHSWHLHAPLRGIFGPNSGYIAHYAPFIWPKSPTKRNAQLPESNFQTRSRLEGVHQRAMWDSLM